jgi:hypothetical protein
MTVVIKNKKKTRQFLEMLKINFRDSFEIVTSFETVTALSIVKKIMCPRGAKLQGSISDIFFQ